MKKITLATALFAVLLSPLSFADNHSEALQLAVSHQDRTPANVTRDQYRHPVETLEFFGVTAKSTVVEISPGGGWYTEILAPLLKAEGKYYAAHQPADATSEYAKKSLAAYQAKLAADYAAHAKDEEHH